MKVFLLLLAMGVYVADSAEATLGTPDNINSMLPGQEEEPVQTKRIEDIPGLTKDMLTEAIEEAKREIQEEESKIPTVQEIDREGHSHQMTHYKRFVPEFEPGRIGVLVKERTVKKLAIKLGMSNKETADALQGLEDANFQSICRSIPPEANLNKVPKGYRTVDGIRNNKKNPNFGRVGTPFTRLLRPDYADGISKPRMAADGTDLPNPRTVSIELFKDINRPSPKLSHLAMVWGQFVNHDTSLGAQPRIRCSGTCGLNGECFGIPIPPGDNAFLDKQKTCITVRRDVPFCGSPIQREQLNARTSFIDASAVYSDNPENFNNLRNSSDRALLIEMDNPTSGLKSFLSKQLRGFCRTPDRTNNPCFRAGDGRVNENQGLSSMHNMWNREHNRIAKKLRQINKKWDADKLFFETRKILIAMMQHITYNEYLPAILDYKTRRRFNLNLQGNGFFWGYDKRVNPGIINAFVSAAFRFGHSQVQNLLGRFGKNYKRIRPSIQMDDFFNPVYFYQSDKGGLDSIVRGLIKERSQRVDRYFSKALTEGLKRFPGDMSDLAAINIQRAREHGIPGYNKYRQLRIVGLKKAKDFADLKTYGEINDKDVDLLQSLYSNVQDIDLFVGGLFEKPVRGGVLGPTFSAIVAEQFKRMRIGDRFWYENRGQFTARQLREIRKVTLAQVICDNTDGIKRIPTYVIQKQRFGNVRACTGRWNSLAGIDLRAWRDKGPRKQIHGHKHKHRHRPRIQRHRQVRPRIQRHGFGR